jgi:hypothetical protein
MEEPYHSRTRRHRVIRFAGHVQDFFEPRLMMRVGKIEDWMTVDFVIGERLSPQAFVERERIVICPKRLATDI